MDNILIVRLSSLGDIIHTLPAYAALRRHFPGARIRWAVEPAAGRSSTSSPDSTRSSSSAGRSGGGTSATSRDGSRRLSISRDSSSPPSSRSSRFPEDRRVFQGELPEALAAAFYKEKLPPFAEADLHVISKNLRLLSVIGIKDEHYEFPIVIPEELRRSVLGKIQRLGYASGQKLFLVNVGAAWETKRWFAERWAELLRAVPLDDAFPMLLWVAGWKKPLPVRRGKNGTAVAPYLTVREVLALLEMTSLLVSGDTFVLRRPALPEFPSSDCSDDQPRRNGLCGSGQDRVVRGELRTLL